MDKKEAQELFKPFLKKDCTSCDAKAGVLCDTSAVWVHAARMIDYRHKHLN